MEWFLVCVYVHMHAHTCENRLGYRIKRNKIKEGDCGSVINLILLLRLLHQKKKKKRKNSICLESHYLKDILLSLMKSRYPIWVWIPQTQVFYLI